MQPEAPPDGPFFFLVQSVLKNVCIYVPGESVLAA